METLINYILQVIMACDVIVKRTEVAEKPVWRFLCGDNVLFIFDEEDVQTFRDVYNLCKVYLSDKELKAYERFFSLCV